MDLKFKAYYKELGMSNVFKIGHSPEWNNGTLPYWQRVSKILPFTGMKDKNGIEIYLDDIIKWKDFNGVERADRVKYINSAFVLCHLNFHLGHYKEKNLEIIGNINLVEEKYKENTNNLLNNFVLGYSEDRGVFLEDG